MVEKTTIAAIDIGGTKIAGALVTHEREVLNLQLFPTPANQGGQAVMQQVEQILKDLIRMGNALGEQYSPVAIGVGTAGQVTPGTGEIAFATDALPGWIGMPIKVRLEQACGLPVAVDNDANVMALGEAAFGAGRGCQHMLGITVGTGVGGGIIIDGKIYHGTHGFAGGIGHIHINYRGERLCPCGRYGCLEAYASTQGIVAEYLQARSSTSNPQPDFTAGNLGVKEIAALAQGGDTLAWQAILHGAEYLGVGIATLVNLFDPEMVVVGGGVANLGDPYFDRVRQKVGSLALPTLAKTLVVPAYLGEQANLVGAACLAWQSLDL